MEAYILAWVKKCSALSDYDVARYDRLVYNNMALNDVRVLMWPCILPENFLTPRRFPGDPPWLCTVPPARFVAVLMEP